MSNLADALLYNRVEFDFSHVYILRFLIKTLTTLVFKSVDIGSEGTQYLANALMRNKVNI